MAYERENWAWSDLDRPRTRWGLFAISGEFVTTAVLWGYTLGLFFLRTSSMKLTPAYALLFELTAYVGLGREEWTWGAAAFCLSLVAPLAVWLDDGRLRLLSLLLQGCFFVAFGISAYVGLPQSLACVTFAALGGWLIVRALNFAWPRALAAVGRTKGLLARERRGRG